MRSAARFALIVVSVLLASPSADPLAAQPVIPVLHRFADMVDPRYWAAQSEERFRDFLRELLPDLRTLIDQAIAARWPAAGNMASASSSLEQLARGDMVWQAASAQMLLQNMEQTATAAQRQPLDSCLRDLASQGPYPSPETVARCRSSAAFYRTMLVAPQSSSVLRYNAFWGDIVAGPAGTSRSSLNAVVFSIERVLEGIQSVVQPRR